ncbi:hypothetical protein DYB37_011066 [Aphanomyces astaci]|uniref:CID domain-containing protein n=1 Tax=Aphanomyces astaci TaxID=112090 RepID=A0A3R6Z9N4_APHAT|nr:hypothetical protein DYB35_010772 [Aphanomyces astaci]RHZ19011.1 hypothetical protein DYB37_011066 [Aphanomyces astaci]
MWIPPPNPDGDAPPPSTNHPPSDTSSYQRSPTNNPNIIMTGQQLAAAKDREKGHRAKFELSGREYDTLCSYLEDVTIDRQSICDVMAFALDHSECAVDISSTIVRSFHVGDSRESKRVHRHVPAMAYVARLFVVSDILHNSSAPLKNASLYRTQFEETLPDIMDTLNAVGHAIVGRMSFNAMRDKVLSVLHAWGQWSLFPPPYLIGLNATFLQKSREVEEDMDVVCAAMDADTLALNDERLKRKCRHAGLVAAGSKHDMYRRLYMLKKFTSSILAYNGAAVIAMAGKNCVAIASDTRLGVQGQTIATDFQKVFRLNDKTFLGLAGLATDVQSVSQLLRFKLNMYKMREEREIKAKTLSALISNLMYEKRFGPWFVEPLVAGLTEDNQPFLSSMDCLGCEMFTKDYVCAGTMEEALHGMCESLFRPDMEPEDLFETISQCLLSACNRDALAGWGGVVHILYEMSRSREHCVHLARVIHRTPQGVTTKVLKTRKD